jgi:hypothetical protein
MSKLLSIFGSPSSSCEPPFSSPSPCLYIDQNQLSRAFLIFYHIPYSLLVSRGHLPILSTSPLQQSLYGNHISPINSRRRVPLHPILPPGCRPNSGNYLSSPAVVCSHIASIVSNSLYSLHIISYPRTQHKRCHSYMEHQRFFRICYHSQTL